MSRDTYRKLILGGAITALGGWLGVANWLTKGVPDEAAAATRGAVAPEKIRGARLVVATLPAAVEQELHASEQAPWPTDPFFCGAAPVARAADAFAPKTDLERSELNGIIRGDPPLAMINGVVVAVGDRLADGSVVTAVDEFSVSLEGPTGSRTLALEE